MRMKQQDRAGDYKPNAREGEWRQVRRPSLMNSQVDPQIPQSTSQTKRPFFADCRFANLL